jgi:hypothetical protein
MFPAQSPNQDEFMIRSPTQLASFGLVCALTSLHAQRMPPTLPSLPPGAAVRVEVRNGERVEGLFDQYRADSLLIRSAALAPVGVPLDSVSRVWVQGRATKTGMLVGGLVGIPLGVLAGAGLCDFERRQENNLGEEVSCTEHYIGATAVGAAAGVAVGALVARFIPKWHLRFRLNP